MACGTQREELVVGAIIRREGLFIYMVKRHSDESESEEACWFMERWLLQTPWPQTGRRGMDRIPSCVHGSWHEAHERHTCAEL